MTHPPAPAHSVSAIALRPLSHWCNSGAKRVFDVLCAGLLLVPALPIMAVVALAVKATSHGPALFRQKRVGRGGSEFELLKFRTMAHSTARAGPGVTQGGDARVTGAGRILRKSKLDELPQLFNVLRGNMSMVGSRPDLAEYLDALPRAERDALFRLRPGITGRASLEFRNEEDLLAAVAPERLQAHYMAEVLPRKVQLDLEYASHATFLTDIGLIIRTALSVTRHNS